MGKKFKEKLVLRGLRLANQLHVSEDPLNTAGMSFQGGSKGGPSLRKDPLTSSSFLKALQDKPHPGKRRLVTALTLGQCFLFVLRIYSSKPDSLGIYNHNLYGDMSL